MGTNTRAHVNCQRSEWGNDQRAVSQALNQWRRHILAWLGEELRKTGQERIDAADSLGIAHRNPELVSSDAIEADWSDLERASIKQARLERTIAAIESMALPEMLVLFARTTKLKTWPWEGDKWQLPQALSF